MRKAKQMQMQMDGKPRYSGSRGTWDVPVRDPTNLCYPSFQPIQRISEDDSFSDNSFFSEDYSISTDSSNRDSTSTDDYFDQIFGDMGLSWNNNSSPWRNSSDSDTSSSSSSPSPMYSRHSDLDHYAARYSEGAADSGRIRSSPFSCPDSTKHCRKLDCSCSCRESGSSKLGRLNPFDNLKCSVSCRNR